MLIPLPPAVLQGSAGSNGRSFQLPPSTGSVGFNEQSSQSPPGLGTVRECSSPPVRVLERPCQSNFMANSFYKDKDKDRDSLHIWYGSMYLNSRAFVLITCVKVLFYGLACKSLLPGKKGSADVSGHSGP
ncbi:hypothetical protein Q8A67_019427 [Cirrhinus molitorella]|uniref:Uncharacterized protein n=1 Tax=Cirrhinus molitorella TaxID=172907 RepID=A0AA88TGD5_9TELE|nr:hypothetical protein Q8A67_019427 [Cirrhinus molitorella]